MTKLVIFTVTDVINRLWVSACNQVLVGVQMVYAFAISLFFQTSWDVLFSQKFINNGFENDIETLNQKILFTFLLDVHALGVVKEVIA